MVINYIQLCLLCYYITFISFLIIILALFITAIITCCRKASGNHEFQKIIFWEDYCRDFSGFWREDSGAFADFLIKSTGKSICSYNLIIEILVANVTFKNQIIDYLALLKQSVCFVFSSHFTSMTNIAMDHFPYIIEQHSNEKLPPAFICTNWVIFSLFLMYFFTKSKSLSLALTTMVSIKVPNQNLVQVQKTPFFPVLSVAHLSYALPIQ